MRIEFKHATGCSYGQFVVFAENDVERMLLHHFVVCPRKENMVFKMHGWNMKQDVPGVCSFNFGWEEKELKLEPPVAPENKSTY